MSDRCGSVIMVESKDKRISDAPPPPAPVTSVPFADVPPLPPPLNPPKPAFGFDG